MEEKKNQKSNESVGQVLTTEEQNWTTSVDDLLFDLKCLMKEYYIATFTDTDSGKALKLTFKNGQSFIISVTTCA